MKSALLFLLMTAAPSFAAIVCDNATINNVYIPKLYEIAEWDAKQLRPYAQQLCELEKQRETLQQQVRETARSLRETNFRICNDLDENSQGNVTKVCVNAHADKLNGLIDQCREVMNLGHNPHNVMIPIDETRVEVACLRGVAGALKNANGL